MRAAPPRAVSVAIIVVAIRAAPPTTVVTWPGVISIVDILGARRCGCAKHAQRRQSKKKLLHDRSPDISPSLLNTPLRQHVPSATKAKSMRSLLIQSSSMSYMPQLTDVEQICLIHCYEG